MTDLHDILAPDAVLERVSAGTRKALFQQLAAAAANIYGLDAGIVQEAVASREKLGSTAFGGGVAIPHGKVPGLTQVRGVFARLAHPLDFDAVDDLPVDVVFMLVSPPDAGATHLKALARVSRALRDQLLVEKLRGAGSRDALVALLTAEQVRDAA
ncbi:PTS system nitrogen regulatory IIA component [Sphingomonas sp. BE270]|uniref:PTS sugar transporter subunit IIA n=1 Tax=unclassified Sphingomonas TaxID=196159 RepID=UPI000F896178|nr:MULTISPECIES: PTS sugar transporter subunit IIA [unclassified Sphingomonas]MDR6848249.1 PTS system nitrogen regulatory IIA component [Sphingomonas sp. BE137]MDR7258911.1 PTS system nitrogen regulatory IIA component [Sphingomonas sp. BE270]RUN75102.1 PTS lactose transporter subunit IIC [Sphingomonas sp. TF3]